MPSTGPPTGHGSPERQYALQALLREALISGRSLDEISTELDSRTDIGEDERAALWLYAWGEQRRLADGPGDLADEHGRLSLVR